MCINFFVLSMIPHLGFFGIILEWNHEKGEHAASKSREHFMYGLKPATHICVI